MIFRVLSVLCYIFAIADLLLCNIFGIDITGVRWSPIVAGVVGAIFGWIGKASNSDPELD